MQKICKSAYHSLQPHSVGWLRPILALQDLYRPEKKKFRRVLNKKNRTLQNTKYLEIIKFSHAFCFQFKGSHHTRDAKANKEGGKRLKTGEGKRKKILATKEGQGSIGQHWNLGQTSRQKKKRTKGTTIEEQEGRERKGCPLRKKERKKKERKKQETKEETKKRYVFTCASFKGIEEIGFDFSWGLCLK